MANGTQITDGVIEFSLRRLAAELGVDRTALKARIVAAGVRSFGVNAGHPTYRLRDVVPYLYGPAQGEPVAANMDPEKMHPVDRNAHWSAERTRVKYLADVGQLVPAPDVHAEMAFIAKTVTRFLATLPDVFERDMRWSPECTEHMEKLTKNLRKELAAKFAKYEDDPDDVRVSP